MSKETQIATPSPEELPVDQAELILIEQVELPTTQKWDALSDPAKKVAHRLFAIAALPVFAELSANIAEQSGSITRGTAKTVIGLATRPKA